MADEGGKAMPNYAKPSIASRLPPNLGLEHEAIKNAFAPGSYTAISDLGKPPSCFADEGMSNISTESMAFRTGKGDGYFTEFEYSMSPFDIAAEISSRERREHHTKMGDIGGGQSFVAPGECAPQKYENTYAYATDPYEMVKDEMLRAKWIEDRKVLAGPFIPGGREKPLATTSRAVLTDILALIYKTLCEDWSHLQPTVFTTAEDLIVIYFSLGTLSKQHQEGLYAYMNILATRGAIVQRYNLKKVNEGWKVTTEDGHIMFAFRPPWVKEKRFSSFKDAKSDAQKQA
eukprot:TRINITY_DN10718_c0_g1_i1.p1 TRINITY_DN10718_c0_g1~~TRINITY_DN10718_c0_g1_i1.p1  ORF type:complete len:307 (+),score=121.67 TRINITY_DN10718_c0_g1_i1:58-921(+)